MKTRAHTPTDFEQLLESAADNTLTDTESTDLADRMRKDPACREAYAEHMMLNAMLSTIHEDSAAAMPVIEPAASPRRRSPTPIYWAVAAAAAIIIAFVLVRDTDPKTIQGQVPTVDLEQKPPVFVAPALRSVARLLTDEKSTIPNAKRGDWLWPGPLKIGDGNVHIAFDSGAEIVVSGPAEIDLQTENRCYLLSGRLTARVPKSASGFAVGTENGIVIDIGTAFGIDLTQKQGTDIHVLQGSVLLSPEGNASEQELVQGNAARIQTTDGRATIETIPFSPKPFSDALFVLDDWPSCNVFHASFDRRPFIENLRARDGSQSHLELQVETGSKQTSTQSLRADGKFGKSIRLGRKYCWLEAPYPTNHSNRARTVSFWVKIPTRATTEEAYAIVAWGSPGPPNAKWQVSWNRLPQHGTIGAIRTEFNGGHSVGSTDLRDGRWHHIVSLFTGGDDADVATHIRHFVDGRLETVTGVHSGRVRWQEKDATDTRLYIGRKFKREDSHFRGQIDELYIFDAALLPNQIEQLRLNNVLP